MGTSEAASKKVALTAPRGADSQGCGPEPRDVLGGDRAVRFIPLTAQRLVVGDVRGNRYPRALEREIRQSDRAADEPGAARDCTSADSSVVHSRRNQDGQRAKADTLLDRSEGRAPVPYLRTEMGHRDRGPTGSRVRREPFHDQLEEGAEATVGGSDF